MIYWVLAKENLMFNVVGICANLKDSSSQGYGFSSGHVWMWELDCEKNLSTEELMLLNCGVGEDSWESLGLQGDPIS